MSDTPSNQPHPGLPPDGTSATPPSSVNDGSTTPPPMPPPPPPPRPPPPPPPPTTQGPLGSGPGGRLVAADSTEEERTYCLLMHLSLLLYVVLWVLVFIVPLLMWLTRRDRSKFVDDHGKETVNFHLSLTLYSIIAIVPAFTVVGMCFTIPAYFAVFVLGIVGMILAATAAGRGEYYRYPMCIRFIS